MASDIWCYFGAVAAGLHDRPGIAGTHAHARAHAHAHAHEHALLKSNIGDVQTIFATLDKWPRAILTTKLTKISEILLLLSRTHTAQTTISVSKI